MNLSRKKKSSAIAELYRLATVRAAVCHAPAPRRKRVPPTISARPASWT